MPLVFEKEVSLLIEVAKKFNKCLEVKLKIIMRKAGDRA